MTTVERVQPAAAAGPFEAWRTRDIVVAAVIGVVFGVVFAAWNTLYAGLGWRTLEQRAYRGEHIQVMDKAL